MKIHSFCSLCGIFVKKSKHKHEVSNNITPLENYGYSNAYVPILLPLEVFSRYILPSFSFSSKVDLIYQELRQCFKDNIHPIDYDTFCLFYDLILAIKDIQFSSESEREAVRVEVICKFRATFNFLENGSCYG